MRSSIHGEFANNLIRKIAGNKERDKSQAGLR
jgi:hypothetical protein